MGSSQSKLSNQQALGDLSVEEISSFVTRLGAKYESYGDAIAENAVDGEILASIHKEEEMKEKMKEQVDARENEIIELYKKMALANAKREEEKRIGDSSSKIGEREARIESLH